MRPKARSSSKLIISSMLALVAQRPLSRMTAVGDGGVGVEVVEPDVDAVVLAGVGLAGRGAEDRVDDRAVGVVDDGERDSWWPRA